MSWRIVYISGRAKLDLKLNYLVVRKEEITKIHLGEIFLLVIDSVQVSITTALLNDIIKRKIKVIFCDDVHNPSSELVGYYNRHNSVKSIKKQMTWDQTRKDIIWKEIIKQKIFFQSLVLKKYERENFELLNAYIDEVEDGDKTNREGHAAKVYFNSLFGNDFNRRQDNNINAALNYGYSILLSIINREIVSLGYLTQLGIFHDNQFNHFNLSCDIMEPLRPMIDNFVLSKEIRELDSNLKIEILSIFSRNVKFREESSRFDIAISKYCKNIIEFLENEKEKIDFISYEL